jgi:hypothetical protein
VVDVVEVDVEVELVVEVDVVDEVEVVVAVVWWPMPRCRPVMTSRTKRRNSPVDFSPRFTD